MRETIDLGSSPIDENCVQVGDHNYEALARAECDRYQRLLEAKLRGHVSAHVAGRVKLRTKENSHDFGTYYEVVASFDADDEAATDAAYWLEANQPTRWDE